MAVFAAGRVDEEGGAAGQVQGGPIGGEHAGARLRFALWLDVEFQPDVDRLEVRVLDGASTTVAWSKAALAQAAYRSWTGVEVDLAPWIGRTVRLQLAFDSVDALDNGGEGVVIDDVDVRAPCAP